MESGTKSNRDLDPLTEWEAAAVNFLLRLGLDRDIDANAKRENMLLLVKALDRGEIDPILGDPDFMEKTERLLLALLEGDRIVVSDPYTFAARKEIFAAAQVIYNHAVVRGFWELHPKFEDAMVEGQ